MIWNLALAALMLPLEVLASNVGDNSIYKLDFTVHRGNSVDDMGVGRKAALRKREFSMEIENKVTYYSVELEIGSERDSNTVLVDTGSADLWVLSSDLECGDSSSSTKKRSIDEINRGSNKRVVLGDRTELLQHENNGVEGIAQKAVATKVDDSPSISGTCASFGSFNTALSDTFQRNESAPAFSIVYEDGTGALGVYGYDTVRVGNISVPDFSFAVANETTSSIGVLGIGLRALEVTSVSDFDPSYSYENFPRKLKSAGLINKVAYSVYLGDTNSETGSILFGAVDSAKYTGELETVPIINTDEALGSVEPREIQIILNSVSFNSSGSIETIFNSSNTAILDTGSTLSYFPRNLLDIFLSSVGGEYSSDLQGFEVPCPSSSSDYVIFNFSGKEISVPYESLVLTAGTDFCILGIFEADFVLLGDNFLRNAYLVMDLEDFEVSLAQARYTDEEDIKVITSSVPDASLAAGYSSTSLNSEGVIAGTASAFSNSARTTDTSSSGSAEENGAASTSSFTNVYITGFLAFIVLVLLA